MDGQVRAQKPAAAPPQKHRQAGQRKLEKPQKPQEHRPVLAELQDSASPIAKELKGASTAREPSETSLHGFAETNAVVAMAADLMVANGDRIYSEALSSLSASHKELSNIIAKAMAEDDRIVNLLHTSEKKTVKLPAETRITDERTGDEIQLGKRVASGKERVDKLEAEVAVLWQQWEDAQKEVDDIKAELMSSLGGDKGGNMRSADGVQESLAAEMAKFEAELTVILEDAHEDARASERVSLSFLPWCEVSLI